MKAGWGAAGGESFQFATSFIVISSAMVCASRSSELESTTMTRFFAGTRRSHVDTPGISPLWLTIVIPFLVSLCQPIPYPAPG